MFDSIKWFSQQNTIERLKDENRELWRIIKKLKERLEDKQSAEALNEIQIFINPFIENEAEYFNKKE